jgi:hypothetical protein
MADPVSWLLIESGWKVVDSSGEEVGRVEEIVGDSSHDIFNGLTFATRMLGRPRYVPAEQVAEITEGCVRLALRRDAAERLAEYEEPPETAELSSAPASVGERVEHNVAPPATTLTRLPLLRRILLWFGLVGRR